MVKLKTEHKSLYDKITSRQIDDLILEVKLVHKYKYKIYELKYNI